MTYNTGNPIGSTDARDRSDNSENLDLAVNSLSQTFVDRLGVTRDTLEGIYQKSAYYRAGTFDAGYTLTNNRQTLAYGNVEYSWSGAFPKVVPAGSTPATAGGVGVGLWSDKTDLMLRSDINIIQKRFACVADAVADTSLTVGKIFETIGYYSGWAATINGPAGGNRFEVVAADTGTADGGSFINLSNGLQAKALFVSKRISVKQFGAEGNCNGTSGNGRDDTIYIQAALDYIEATGGGVAILEKTKGQYRVTSEIRIPSYCTLEGVNKTRYPFNNGVANNSCLCADFYSLGHWVVDSKTKNAGSYYAYNAFTNYSAPSDMTFNSVIKDVLITSVGVMPYGGIRFIGCPGSVVDNCSAYNVGIGLFVNWCFGGSYVFHGLTHYYGAIFWDSANANDAEIYATKITSSAQIVPVAYLPSFMSAHSADLVSVAKLSTNAHYNRAFGLVIGSNGATTSTSNKISYTGEAFSGGSFQYYAYGTSFTKYYVEGAVSEMMFGMVAAFSRYSTANYHCYLVDGSAVLFDMGLTINADYKLVGLIQGSYGFGPYTDNTSSVTFNDVSVSATGFPKQFNVFYTHGYDIRTPTLLNSWVNAGGIKRPSNYVYVPQLNRVKLRGSIMSGSTSAPAFLLPSGFRPPYAVDFSVAGGTVRVLADGNVYVTSGTVVDLDAVEFEIY